jgi:hypothetical protein
MTEDECEPPDDEEIDRMHAEEDEERERRAKAAARQIRLGFLEMQELFGHEKAWRDLDWFLKHNKPPRKPKGKHQDPRIDEDIVAAHKDAPDGGKLKAVYAVGARYRLSQPAALQRLRRAQRLEKANRDWTHQIFGAAEEDL